MMPILVPDEFNGNNAFDGLPMGDWLKKIQEENDLEVQFYSAPVPNSISEELENCCGDPEYCVQASCVVCIECGSTDTIRTTEPDENNVSEFECMDCECFFMASNP